MVATASLLTFLLCAIPARTSLAQKGRASTRRRMAGQGGGECSPAGDACNNSNGCCGGLPCAKGADGSKCCGSCPTTPSPSSSPTPEPTSDPTSAPMAPPVPPALPAGANGCPCDINPGTLGFCSSFSTNGCGSLPRMNFLSATSMIADQDPNFLDNTNSLPRDTSTCSALAPGPVPIACARGGTSGSQYYTVGVGNSDEVVLTCDNSDGVVLCASDADCGGAAGSCSTFGTDSYAGEQVVFGRLSLRVEDDYCSAKQEYRNGCVGYGSVFTDYYRATISTQAEFNACKAVIRDVCQHYGLSIN